MGNGGGGPYPGGDGPGGDGPDDSHWHVPETHSQPVHSTAKSHVADVPHVPSEQASGQAVATANVAATHTTFMRC